MGSLVVLKSEDYDSPPRVEIVESPFGSVEWAFYPNGRHECLGIYDKDGKYVPAWRMEIERRERRKRIRKEIRNFLHPSPR